MSVYTSFHYQRDAARVQQVLQMGVIAGQQILSAQDWESVRGRGNAAIEKWIDEQMSGKTTLVVLVGYETASRPWVDYEIRKAWDAHMPVVGIRVNGLAPLNQTQDPAGANPFASIGLKNGSKLSTLVPLHTPTGSSSQQVYANIAENLATWVKNAVKRS